MGFAIKMILNQLKDSVPQSLETVTLKNSINPGSCDPDRGIQTGTSLLTPKIHQRRPTSQEI